MNAQKENESENKQKNYNQRNRYHEYINNRSNNEDRRREPAADPTKKTPSDLNNPSHRYGNNDKNPIRKIEDQIYLSHSELKDNPLQIKSSEEGDTRAIGIACRLDSPKALQIVQKISDFLRERGERIYYETRIASKFIRHFAKSIDEMNNKNTKFIISIGGDGTILRICQSLPRGHEPPLLGVNLGSVGFLDESEMETLLDDLDKILNGKYWLEKRIRLSTSVGKYHLPDALNEVLIISSKPSKVLYTRIEVDDVYFTSSYLDGLIISTHTGSTAYALSAGGCLLDPRVRAIEIVPLNPFVGTGVFRPLLVPETSKLNIYLERARLNGLIIIDGQTQYKVVPEIKIEIHKSNYPVYLIRLHSNQVHSYFQKVRDKILFSRKIIDDTIEE